EGPAFVFAAKDGYRFQAKAVDLEAGPLMVELSRVDEPPNVASGPQGSALPAEEEKALARRLFLPYAERVLAKGTAADKYQLVADAVRVDPAMVAERLEAMKFVEPDYLNLARIQVVDAIAKDNLDEALAQAEFSPDAQTRAWCYLNIADVAPGLE